MSSKRERFFSGASWQQQNGYCRAIRVEQQIFIAGTTSVDEQGRIFAPGNIEAQTKRSFQIVEQALKHFGANFSDVVRTRVFLTNIEHWPAVGEIHRQLFGQRPPASTLLQVSALIDPQLLVEIEVDAVICAEANSQ